MAEINYEIQDPIELNHAYMPFVKDGGLFVPSMDEHKLGEKIIINLLLPGQTDYLKVEGKVIWITPKNALHMAVSGFGVQLTGEHAKSVLAKIQSALDTTSETGSYTYWLDDEIKK